MAKEKKKKQTRNKARDMLGDYYKTNREYSKENEAAWKEEQKNGKKGKLSKTELTYVVIIVIGIIGLAVKYLVF